MPVAYNPYDPNQQKLLGALSLSEIGSAKNGQYLGTGGADLRNAPRNEYGFPQWGGIIGPEGPSHAAGFFQFQPGTWEQYAKSYDLDFQDASDQKAGAWYLAQDTYKARTGRELSDALAAGDYASIESALGASTWIGARGKLAAFLSGGKSAILPDGTNEISADTSGGFMGGLGEIVGGIADAFNPFKSSGGFVRWGLFLAGALILMVAVWRLLSDSGVITAVTKAVPVGRAAGAVAKLA